MIPEGILGLLLSLTFPIDKDINSFELFFGTLSQAVSEIPVVTPEVFYGLPVYIVFGREIISTFCPSKTARDTAIQVFR